MEDTASALPRLTDAARSAFAIEVDIDDYIARGNPFSSSHATTEGGMLRESISIHLDSVIAGSARVSTAHVVPEMLAPDIEAALN